MSHPRKNYAKALLRVIPFNDYSGSYSTTTMEVFFVIRMEALIKSQWLPIHVLHT